MDDRIGRTLKGTLEITACLGAGAMGTVYRAKDTSSGRDVAVKIMHPSRMREPGMLQRFRREATAMRRVHHPNAVEVYSHGVDQGLVYLAMELVDGESLASILGTFGRLSPERAARIVAEVCSALAEAHRHGVVHRDVKPDNIMLAGPTGDTVKLVDFGIAKPSPLCASDADDDSIADERSIHDSIPDDVDLEHTGELTTAGMLIGSPGYMAPEQWSSSAVDDRTDVYACGALLYELVTGHLPFEDSNPFMVAQRQLYEEPRAPHELCHEVPLSLSAIILRAIAPSRDARWQSASELRDALRAFLVERTLSPTLGFDATLPLEILSPVAGKALPMVQDDPPHDEALQRTMILDAVVAPARAPSPAIAPSYLVARSGRPTPLPPPSVARSSAPPPVRGALVAAHLRAVLPLCAAFLTLGFIVGMLIVFPIFR